MFDIVLHEPQIPPNTGNIMRLAANTGCRLHLIQPMGFTLDDRRMRRAGLDYHEFSNVQVWPSFSDLHNAELSPRQSEEQRERENSRPNDNQISRVFMFSTHHTQLYSNTQYRQGDYLVFGAETHGLPVCVRQSVPSSQQLRLPMMANNRSLNLSNSVAIVVYEAWRQCGFKGSRDRG